MVFPPIENYGVIGNLCTAALVRYDSSIDFFCFPEFDSPTVFAGLLDPVNGGSFSLHPELEGMKCKQMYVAETNILLTRYLSERAAAELTDFMPVTGSKQKNQIVRTIHVLHGEVTFELRCRPAFDYARSAHTIQIDGNNATFIPANVAIPRMLLRSTVRLEERDGTVIARFTLQQKQTAVFILGSPECAANQEVGCSDPELDEPSILAADRDLTDTLRYWRTWIGKSTYTGRWREVVNRSALILKLMTSRHHGSLVAAPTFGLPEQIGGERNWDYRFTWIRDAAFTLYAFMRLGLRSEADDFFDWMRRQLTSHHSEGQPMQVMYGLDGRTELAEEELSHLCGYRNSRPVRIGNKAYEQLQLDIYGDVLDSVYLYSKYGHALPHDGWNRIKDILEWLGQNWKRPDEGIWEIRGGNKHFLHSRLMCWVAFDRAIRLAHKRSLSAPLREWYDHRDAIVDDIYANFWNEELQAFTQHKDTNAMDAAVLLMPLVRFISPIDPRWLSTLTAIENALAEGPLVYRYRRHETSDGLNGEEGSFTACSFWFVECLARAGQEEKARQYFEKLLAHANHLWLFSEEIGRDGHQLGNFPQALTHLALISAAVYLDRALSGKPPQAWA
jgi:GH15 family glucan-1,4-alpha-glucosidase